jgi:hypothetical protein
VRTVIALELDVSANGASQPVDLSRRLEQRLADAVREHGAQGHIQSLQLLITFAESVPSAASEGAGWPTEPLALPPAIKPSADATGFGGVTAPRERLLHDMPYPVSARRQQDSQDVDPFEQFPAEQIDGPPFPIEPASIFTDAPAWAAAPDLVRAEPIEDVRRFAENVHASWRDAAPGPLLRAALSKRRRHEVIFACAVAVLVGLQAGGRRTGSAERRGVQLESKANSARDLGTIVRLPESSWKPMPTTPGGRYDTSRAGPLQPAGSVVTALRAHDPQRSRASQTAVSEATGSLLIESRPSGGRVFLNQVLVGVTPLALPKVRARSYAVGIDLGGYARWSRGIYVISQQTTRVTALLEPDR